ncbi:conserved hypothetical protein [Cellulomonas flavigena DSM 20109]|uniref:Uncharacterized protein n=1 Tax=Cellulomonas flavigena (strain ATCC 482 / DSM 20109 / BCRC 11376 / JCM 18109 / NBRC 3775 / NCIMB 8073 / NRS 134) TaxID=446466 RepID=D5UEP4_CELFN|nr:hypothetical protein [Cellulomonas flavigena]ADG74704.1 conserved hypothetical protein [Cellulomonas flavigena DSM 20109]
MTHAATSAPAPAVELAGHIAGVGTAQGTRLVVGRWRRSPLGGFADVMVERADGTRVLLAPRDDVAALVTRLYTFDAVHLVDVRVVADRATRTWTVVGGPLHARLTLGARTPLGALLGLVPARLVTARATAGLVDTVAGLVVPGVRTRGRGADGSPEVYVPRDQHAVVALAARWGGEDLGPLRPVDPPVRFGFSSTPANPAVTAIEVSIGTS